MNPNAERITEWLLFRSRLVLVPFYFGLVLGVAVALVKGGQEMLHLVPHVLESTEEEVVLVLLKLVDLTLLANLLIIVGLASYENFVSTLGRESDKDRPKWLTQVSFSNMKLKLLGSIIAISAIHLLASFLSVDAIPEKTLRWQVSIHLAIAGSAVLVALADFLGHRHGHHEPKAEAAPRAGQNH